MPTEYVSEAVKAVYERIKHIKYTDVPPDIRKRLAVEFGITVQNTNNLIKRKSIGSERNLKLFLRLFQYMNERKRAEAELKRLVSNMMGEDDGFR